MKQVVPSDGKHRGNGRIVAALAVAAGALLGVAFVALSTSSGPSATADDVHLDTAPGFEPSPVARTARGASLDDGVNWAAVEPSADVGPMAVAAYER